VALEAYTWLVPLVSGALIAWPARRRLVGWAGWVVRAIVLVAAVGLVAPAMGLGRFLGSDAYLYLFFVLQPAVLFFLPLCIASFWYEWARERAAWASCTTVLALILCWSALHICELGYAIEELVDENDRGTRIIDTLAREKQRDEVSRALEKARLFSPRVGGLDDRLVVGKRTFEISSDGRVASVRAAVLADHEDAAEHAIREMEKIAESRSR
jgi:hypothetical protein